MGNMQHLRWVHWFDYKDKKLKTKPVMKTYLFIQKTGIGLSL